MKFIINLSLIVAMFFFSCNDEETGEKLTGTIRGLDGTPVSGAAITLKNSGNSTTSDASGKFEMSLSEDQLINVYKSSGDSVIDTLVATHNDYLHKRKWVYDYSDEIDAILWDKKFRLTTEVSGWVDQSEYFATFDTIQLYDLIDGGATKYTEQGLIDGIFQLLKNGNFSYDIFFYNFGTSQKATNMFTIQSNSVSSKVVIPGYDESIAVGDEFLGGAIIYAHFSQFELELSLGGYADIEQLKADAAQFLQVYESKIGSIKLKR